MHARAGRRTWLSLGWLTVALAVGCGDDPATSIDHAPTLDAATASTPEDTAVDVTLTAADRDGDPVTIAVAPPAHGAATVAGLVVTYTPAPDFHGTEALAVTATAGGRTASAALQITVTPVNDPPVATDDVRAALEDQAQAIPATTLLANDTDVDGDTLTVTAVGDATGGTVGLTAGTVDFTPATNFTGDATFTYTVSDGTATDTALVTVQVASANDPPVAVADSATTAEDTLLTITAASLVANDTDPEGQALTVTAVDSPTNGTVALTAGSITFTPAADVSGTGSFSYTVSDGAATAVGTVTVTITPVNDPPVAVADARATAEDTPLTVTAASLTTNDTDVDGGALTVTAVGSPVNGTVALSAGSITFTPAANVNGTGAFSYTVSDGAATATGTVTVTITPVNDPPVAVDDARSTGQNTPLIITAASLAANDTDVDGGSLTVTAVSAPVNGTVALAAGTITFTPTAGFIGTARFVYTVSDGAATDTGLVTVTVSATNPILQLFGGNAHICALATNGHVKCWGLNAYGNLGLGDVNKRGDEPNEMGANLPEVDLGTGRTAVTLTGGGEHNCAILDNSTVKCWGYNSAGQLGLGFGASRGNAPGQMGDALPTVDLGTGRTAVQLEAGAEHTCAVLDNGAVKCWGANDFGQLGLGDVAYRGDDPGEMGDALPAVDLGTGRTARQVWAGGFHTCALLDNLTVKCWGRNDRGQLGLGDTANRGDGPGEMGNALPAVALGTGLTVAEVALGELHSCARFTNRTVKCWGFGSFGALGLGGIDDHGDAPGEMGDNLPAIALGTGVTPDLLTTMLYDTCILTTADQVKCWGGDLNGQLGQGDNIYRGDQPGEMGDNLPFIEVW